MDSKVDTKMGNTVDYMMSDIESFVAALLETSVKHYITASWRQQGGGRGGVSD